MTRRLLILLPLILTACDGSSVRDTIGMTRSAPDEFRVMPRPPLSVPPEFNLRPPAQPGEEVAGAQVPAREQAQSLITGGEEKIVGTAPTAVVGVTTNELSTPADSQFLNKAGANVADTNIRSTLSQEYGTKPAEEKTLLDSFTSFKSNEPVVDAKGEAERLKENKEAGKSPDEGETPMSKSKDSGTLGKIFGY